MMLFTRLHGPGHVTLEMNHIGLFLNSENIDRFYHPSILHPSATAVNIPSSPAGGWMSGGSSPGPNPGGVAGRKSVRLAVYLWNEVFLRACGRQSYAGNVSLRSARARPEKPTTLFKEMAARGPLANSPPLRFSVCSAQSAPSFLPSL